jgi:hypothetical protein
LLQFPDDSILCLVDIDNFQEPKYIDITVEAGTSYYLKYDEENKMDRSEHTVTQSSNNDYVIDSECAYHSQRD